MAMKMPKSKSRIYEYKTNETLIGMGGAHRLLLMVLILMAVMTMTMTMTVTSTSRESDDLERRSSNSTIESSDRQIG